MSQGRDARPKKGCVLHAIDINWVRATQRPTSPNGGSIPLSIADFFCGCGGMTLGVWEGARRQHRKLKIQLAVDSSPEAIGVYKSNFAAEQGRVRTDDMGRIFDGKRGKPATSIERHWIGKTRPIDLIVAGPPCQGHSDLNNSTRRADPRNWLYLRVVRAAELLNPQAIIIENVPTVVHDQHRVVQTAIKWLKGIGYSVTEKTLSLSRFGIPQLRKRHVLVATLTGEFTFEDLQSLPQESIPTAGDFLAGLEDEPESNEARFYQPSTMTATNTKRVAYLFSKQLYNLPNHMRPSCHRDKDHAYVSMYGRMFWDKPAQTLTSGFGSMGQGRYVHPTRKRLITPHEAARIQGFPDFFDFSNVKKVTSLREMIANAVPPQFMAALVTQLIVKKLL